MSLLIQHSLDYCSNIINFDIGQTDSFHFVLFQNYFSQSTFFADFPDASTVKCLPGMQETWVPSLGWEDPLEKGQATTPVFLDFLCGSAGKESTCNERDLGSIPGLGRSSGAGKGYPLQFWPRECHGLYSPWGGRVRHD